MTSDRPLSTSTKVTIGMGDWIKFAGGLIVYTAAIVYGAERRVGFIESNVRDHELRLANVEKKADAMDARAMEVLKTLSEIREAIARIEERTRK